MPWKTFTRKFIFLFPLSVFRISQERFEFRSALSFHAHAQVLCSCLEWISQERFKFRSYILSAYVYTGTKRDVTKHIIFFEFSFCVTKHRYETRYVRNEVWRNTELCFWVFVLCKRMFWVCVLYDDKKVPLSKICRWPSDVCAVLSFQEINTLLVLLMSYQPCRSTSCFTGVNPVKQTSGCM